MTKLVSILGLILTSFVGNEINIFASICAWLLTSYTLSRDLQIELDLGRLK